MSIRNAVAIWEGTLKEGNGQMKLGSGAFDSAFTWASRFADGMGTNPEELIGAAHAGCFSMFLSAQLTKAGFPPASIQTTAKVHLGSDETGPKITLIELTCRAEIPGMCLRRSWKKRTWSPPQVRALALRAKVLSVSARLGIEKTLLRRSEE